MLTIAIGSDHRGYEHKAVIQQGVTIETKRIEWIDVGCFSATRTDYPPYAHAVTRAMITGKAQLGVLLCGTGVGMTVAANRFNGIYAALVWNVQTAARSKEEDNANVLSLPADYITPEQAVEMVIIWLNAQFLDDRYESRIEMIDKWGGLHS
jgi:ribose 5-phosphate isomerase B